MFSEKEELRLITSATDGEDFISNSGVVSPPAKGGAIEADQELVFVSQDCDGLKGNLVKETSVYDRKLKIRCERQSKLCHLPNEVSEQLEGIFNSSDVVALSLQHLESTSIPFQHKSS